MKSKITELKSKQGQRGPTIKLHFSDLTDNEKKLIAVLAQPGRPVMTIKELVVSCGWKSLRQGDTDNENHKGKARGNSRVRNTLRRLIRAEWIGHPDGVGDGEFRLTSSAAARLRRLKPAKRLKAKEEPRKATG